ncbi:Ig-like domain-containing protein [Halomonas sp. M5N1S17]|uniref:Ig-like domain-containing protein n=1 Tax=Halomonas alkalisoli TaxID=2907158 RepID=UPI001F32010C|nr:Ig-like domain-containing protein [Halomonas alkalisoli]MCE9665415.1 Ig-like domain-containing protein [Halomonas alkalisoli]
MRTLISIALFLSVLSFGGAAQAQLTLEIPEEEFEAAEDYKPIPPPSMDIDLTGTLPEAVLESMLGKTPYDFVDVVWGMEVTGNWTDAITGTGTLQVTNFTEGRGASTQVDPERYTGQQGFRMYNARLQSEGDHVFRLFAAFPPDHGGVAFGTELDDVKGLFEVLLCHMFEPDRRGCIDYPDEYYETELPELSKMHIMLKGNAYKIEFAARVRETRTHRERGYSSTDMTGRIGDVRGWVCDRASWEEDPEACAATEPLEVASNSPPHQRENVHLETPKIEIEFNFPVAADVLDANFSLTTRDIRSEALEMTGRIVPVSDTLFRFDPDFDLESGIIYEARIKGGKDGVESRNGATMTSSAHWWRFTTLVDLDNHGGPVDEPLRSHVYQTVRDAPLVVGKPALQRIYVDWEPHGHIHKGWQPESFPAELDISVVDQSQWRIDPQAGGSIDGNVVRVVRSDLLEQGEIERHARNTINVFGWSPDAQGGTSVIETRLTPHDPHPSSVAAQDVIAERDVQHWHTDPAPLVFRYTFLKVGSWSDGVPEAERQAALTMVGMAEDFAVQLMPIKEAYGIGTGRDADQKYANIYRDVVLGIIDKAVQAADLQSATLGWVAENDPRRLFREEPEIDLEDDSSLLQRLGAFFADNPPNETIPTLAELYLVMNDSVTPQLRMGINEQALKNTIRAVREEIGSFFSGNDILVVFYPPDFYGAGQSFGQTPHSDGRHGVAMPITLDRSPSALAEGLVHELAHYFGLPHRPGEASDISYPASEFSGGRFDGFRLALDGMSGHNKSSIEGNGEHPTTLAPLMWPYLIERRLAFVSRDEYLTLLRAFQTR